MKMLFDPGRSLQTTAFPEPGRRGVAAPGKRGHRSGLQTEALIGPTAGFDDMAQQPRGYPLRKCWAAVRIG